MAEAGFGGGAADFQGCLGGFVWCISVTLLQWLHDGLFASPEASHARDGE
jgi:hypothetical protein